MSTASRSKYAFQITQQFITWVQLEDPQVTWLCFPLKLQGNLDFINPDEVVCNLSSITTGKPDYVEEKANIKEKIAALNREFDDIGFLRRSMNESITGFDETTVDGLIKTVLSDGNFSGQIDRIPEGKKKRTQKVAKLINIYEDRYLSDGLYKLMMGISKYYKDIFKEISDKYKVLITEHRESERESEYEEGKLHSNNIYTERTSKSKSLRKVEFT